VSAVPRLAEQSSAPAPAPRLRAATWLSIYSRMLAVQGSWNYEILLGNGIGFCVEPALRYLPGGQGGVAYRQALARQSHYFNAHPYMTALAVGALARAELEGEDPARIERFRTALCGPLGAVGDRLVWAAWLPFCSVVALAAFGLGMRTAGVLALFLGTYNAGHLALRAWGLRAGWRAGMRVAQALAVPALRQGPAYVVRAAALVAGVAVPLALQRLLGPGRGLLGATLVLAAVGAFALARLQGRAEGWRVALLVLGAFVLYSVLVHG
jgi:mannose PTS system EIID component